MKLRFQPITKPATSFEGGLRMLSKDWRLTIVDCRFLIERISNTQQRTPNNEVKISTKLAPSYEEGLRRMLRIDWRLTIGDVRFET